MQQQRPTLLYFASRLLFAGKPNAMLANALGQKRSTVRSWIRGDRRPPIWVLELVRRLLNDYTTRANDLAYPFDCEIRLWKAEPKRRVGFLEIRERDGPGSTPRDARWRYGRPRKHPPAKAKHDGSAHKLQHSPMQLPNGSGGNGASAKFPQSDQHR